MSNFLALATVTATLALMLEEQIALDITDFGFNVVPKKPEDSDDRNQAQVLIYLYQATPNPQWRNDDLPTRNGRGQTENRPRAAIDLHYLLTFYGAEDELQPQRLMGSVLHILHAQPVLTPAWVDFASNHADYLYLTDSDLGTEIERVKFTPQAFSLEELSKLWSVLLQTPYSLSIAYVASVVFVEPQAPTRRAVPVQERSVIAVPSVTGEPIISPNMLDGLQLWLRSDLGVTFDAGRVSEWQDQSGNDRHASQDDDAQRPVFIAHGIGQLPVLSFDGTDDRLAIDWQLNSTFSGLTVIAIVRTSNTNAQAVVSFDGDQYWELSVSDGAASPRVRWQTTDTTVTTHTLTADRAFADTRWHALMAMFEAGGAPDKRLFVDGIAVGSEDGHGVNDLGSGTRFGFIGVSSNADALDGAVGGDFLDGDVAEIVVYDRALPDGEREQVERYFAKRYSNV